MIVDQSTKTGVQENSRRKLLCGMGGREEQEAIM